MTGTALTIPPTQELEALSPTELWDIAEGATALADAAWDRADELLRQWVEVEHKTQAGIAKMVGRSVSTINEHCQRLGLPEPAKGKGTKGGRPRKVFGTENPPDDDPEPVEGEVVDDEEDAAPAPDKRYTTCPTCGHRVRKDQPLATRR